MLALNKINKKNNKSSAIVRLMIKVAYTKNKIALY